LRRARRALLGLSSVFFTLVGLLIAIFEPDDRLFGFFAALFFGCCTLALFMPMLARTGGPDRRVRVISHHGLRTEALVFPLSTRKIGVAGIAAAGWAVAGVILVLAPSTLADPGEETAFFRLLGIVLTLLFGGVAVFAGLQQLRGGGFVALLPEGVLGRSPVGGSFVPWEAIEEVGVLEMYDTPMVAIRVTDPATVETPGWARLFSRANRAVAGADVTYASLVAPEEEVARTIAHYMEHPEERSRIGEEHRYNSRPPSTVPR
jgi:hypothetical protein